MANYLPSVLSTAQAMALAGINQFELKFRNPTMFNQFTKNGEYMAPSHNVLKTRDDRATAVTFLANAVIASAAGRSHNYTGVKADSFISTPTWTSKSWVVKSSLKSGDNNVVGNQEQLNHSIASVMRSISAETENLCAAYAHAQRQGNASQVIPGATYNTTGAKNTYDITEGFANVYDTGYRLPLLMQTGLQALNRGDEFDIFCDSDAWMRVQVGNNQGSANNINTQFQYNSSLSFFHCPELNAIKAGLAATKAYFIAVPRGAYGVMTWIPKQNREAIDTKTLNYYSFIHPQTGVQLAVNTREVAEDGSADGGYTQDVATHYEFSLDYSFFKAPSQVANESAFVGFAVI